MSSKSDLHKRSKEGDEEIKRADGRPPVDKPLAVTALARLANENKNSWGAKLIARFNEVFGEK